MIARNGDDRRDAFTPDSASPLVAVYVDSETGVITTRRICGWLTVEENGGEQVIRPAFLAADAIPEPVRPGYSVEEGYPLFVAVIDTRDGIELAELAEQAAEVIADQHLSQRRPHLVTHAPGCRQARVVIGHTDDRRAIARCHVCGAEADYEPCGCVRCRRGIVHANAALLALGVAA